VGCKHPDPQDPAALPIARQRRPYRSHAHRDRHTRRRSAAAARRRTHRRATAPASKIILLGVLRRHVLGLASATDFARTWSTGSSGPGDRVLDVGCGTGIHPRDGRSGHVCRHRRGSGSLPRGHRTRTPSHPRGQLRLLGGNRPSPRRARRLVRRRGEQLGSPSPTGNAAPHGAPRDGARAPPRGAGCSLPTSCRPPAGSAAI